MALPIIARAAAFALVASFAANSAPTIARADERPNIVFLFSDDQTATAASCYGNPDIRTPNIDSLARDGVRFTNHYNTTSICMASRSSVMTGLYEYRHGCNFDHGDMARAIFERSYPALLRRSGYFTGFAGKIGFVIEGEPFEALADEFDVWAGGPGQTFYETEKNPAIASYAERYPHSSRAYAAWSDDFLSAAKGQSKPFCMSISFKAPHLPSTFDPLDADLYEGVTFTRPANYGVERSGHLAPQALTSRAANSYREWVDDYDQAARDYYRLIAGVDAAVGMIRESLARHSLTDKTVIIFTSDNGYNSGSHGFGDKVVPYEEGSKSPLIIVDPRLDRRHAGADSSAVTGNVDMAATILALAGVDTSGDLDGRSLLPLLTNPQGDVRDHLPLFNFWGVPTAQSMAVVTRDAKYIHWYYAGDGMRATEELFDLANDRLEMRNLATDPSHATLLASMRSKYDAELEFLTSHVTPTHGYPDYATLFDRGAAWTKKAPLLKPYQGPSQKNQSRKKSKRARRM